MPSPPARSYASPQRKSSVRLLLRSILIFWCFSILTAISVVAFDVFGPLENYNTYLGGPTGTFEVLVVVCLVMFTGAAIVMAGIAVWVDTWSDTRSCTRTISFWVLAGVIMGLACTVPDSVDVAMNDRTFTEGGSRKTSGWGGHMIDGAFLLCPCAAILLSLRRTTQPEPSSIDPNASA